VFGQLGTYLLYGVEALRASDADFGRVLTAVRGVGLMVGVEFSGKRESFGQQSFLGVLAQQKILVRLAHTRPRSRECACD
jgi:acetylornithine/succinyldiaminopimelate/putrescine aminotransferase